MRIFRLVATLACCVTIFVLLDSPVGGFPPLGRFLNPFSGFWTNNRAHDALPAALDVPGLIDEVDIVWDKRRVPHIVAGNLHDLYLAQGYVVARDRLWQMDFQSRAAAGRLSEIVGSKAVEHDRFRRRIGLPTAAEKCAALMMASPESRVAVEAFSAGVNAYIESLDRSQLPVEYKILDYEPEPWSPVKCALLLKSMAYTLTFRNSEHSMTKTAQVLDTGLMDLLYPELPSSMVEAPPAGSNAWAVSGGKTHSGFPILCSDPHLSLTLPSVWYEIQLMAPGMNVYGVTIPGAPGVIIGFNSNIAWGTTNAGSDVLDWYHITYRDSTRREYRHGTEWKAVTVRPETIKVRRSDAVIDSVFETHHGPIVLLGGEPSTNPTIPPDAALRWTANDESNELLVFLRINAATDHTMLLEAARHYDSPAQNFVYADIDGDIGSIHAGKFPVRRRGQGRFVSDGADPADDWSTWVPRDELPQVINPPEEFVVSANEAPVSQNSRYYLGSEYAASDRSSRIREVLRSLEEITPEMMSALQNDALSTHARAVLPRLLAVLRGCPLDEIEMQLLSELETWNCQYQRELYGPTIFEEWWDELNDGIWHDELERDSISLRWPRKDVTASLIVNGSIQRFADDGRTPKQERWPDVVCNSFHRAASLLEGRLGPLGDPWQWGFARGTSIPHLAGITGFGRSSLKTGGVAGVINATTASSGPSWRMVVELGPELKAWGIYPGGQSGNPGSDAYDSAVSDWVRGFNYELSFLRSPSDSLGAPLHHTRLRRSP